MTSFQPRALAPDTSAVNNRNARAAGALFLAIMATAVVAEFVLRAGLLHSSDAAATRAAVAANEAAFRLSITLDLLCFLMIPAISLLLYRLLSPISSLAAGLGLLFRMGEAITMVCVAVFSLGVLYLSQAGGPAATAPTATADALTLLALRLHGGGYHFGLIFWSVGTVFFAVAMWQARLVPRALAGPGVFAGVSGVLVHFAWLNASPVFAAAGDFVYLPAFLFEVGVGLWLLIFGFSREAREARRAGVSGPDSLG